MFPHSLSTSQLNQIVAVWSSSKTGKDSKNSRWLLYINNIHQKQECNHSLEKKSIPIKKDFTRKKWFNLYVVGYEAGFLEALEIKKIKKIKLEEKERMTYTIIKRVHIDVLDSPKSIVFGEPGGCHLLFICCGTNTNVHAQTHTNWDIIINIKKNIINRKI